MRVAAYECGRCPPRARGRFRIAIDETEDDLGLQLTKPVPKPRGRKCGDKIAVTPIHTHTGPCQRRDR